jgi:mannonate dehydratase
MPSNVFEGPNTPKICLIFSNGEFGSTDEAATARHLKQLGVNHCISGPGAGQIPWTEERLRPITERFKGYGLPIGNIMIGGFNRAIYNRPGKDEDIENVIKSIRAAGKVGLPVVEYNWYAHRAMEGYFAEVGRAESGWTGFDYERPVDVNGTKVAFKDLPALEQEGAHTLDEMWTNISYFLKAVVPEAE